MEDIFQILNHEDKEQICVELHDCNSKFNHFFHQIREKGYQKSYMALI